MLKSLQTGRDCFIRYVHSKIVKRLASYRSRGSSQDLGRKVLLPLSGGISSLVLLHILDQRIRKQNEGIRGRATYELHVLVVESSYLPDGPTPTFVEAVRERYPTNTVTSIPLTDLTDVDLDILRVFGGLEPESPSDEFQHDSGNQIDRILQGLSSPTARTDLLEALLTRLVAQFAKAHNCESIFWGHSDTRLAARTLASVAKGRGAAVPFQVLDGPTPLGVTFNFPLRDLFKAELETFSELDTTFPSELVIENGPTTKSVSNRDLSIDQLITNYITSQGEKYPSIMANVVRTAGKLHAPEFTNQSMRCRLCGLLIEEELAADSSSQLCYGCIRSSEGSRTISG